MAKARVLVRRAHLCVALALGGVLALMGLSGSLLVYHDALDRALNPGLWSVDADGPRRLDASLQRVRAAFPDAAPGLVRLPEGPGVAYEVWLRGADGVVLAYVDPYRARLLGRRGQHAGVLGFLENFHNRLFGGALGRHGLGLFAAAGLVMAASGLVLWWPRRGRWRDVFRIRRRRPAMVQLYDLHRVAGGLAVPLLLLSLITGLALVYHETSKRLLTAGLGGTAGPRSVAAAPAERAMPLSPAGVLATARARLPADARATWLSLPGGADRPYRVRFREAGDPHPNGNSTIALDPATGSVVALRRASEAPAGLAAAHLRYPLHVGTALGPAGPPLMAALGLVPGLLLGTGLAYWLKKPRARRRP